MVGNRLKRAPSTSATKKFEPRVDTNRFRQKRFELLVQLITKNYADKEVIKILDIGGTKAYWEGVATLWEHLPLEITIVNLGADRIDEPPYFIREGDACNMADFEDNSFDLVHSNSVIEHVGHWQEMCAMAREVRRLAPHYFIQTPNFWFPFEPHYRTAFFQWYPETTRARMLMRKKRGFRGPSPDMNTAMENIQTVNLLSYHQMRELFPEGKIDREKFFGMTKSLIATR